MSKTESPYLASPAPGDPRRTEAWALTQAALRMKAGQESTDREALLAAARLNWRLWTILQAEMLNPQTAIPDEIRGNMLSLARFVDGRMAEFLSDPEPAKLDALISINRELAGGLWADPPSNENGPLPDAGLMRTSA